MYRSRVGCVVDQGQVPEQMAFADSHGHRMLGLEAMLRLRLPVRQRQVVFFQDYYIGVVIQ